MNNGSLIGLVPRVQGYILERGIPIPGWHAGKDERARFTAAVAQALVELRLNHAIGDDRPLAGAAEQLAGMMTGVGVLQPLLTEEGVEEIIVRDGFVQVERWGQIEDVGMLADNAHFLQVAQRAADLGQRVIKGNRPYVLVDLPDGSRFTSIVPGLSRRGVAINIRVFSRAARSLADLARLGTFDGVRATDLVLPDPGPLLEVTSLPPIARLLATVAANNLASILISGEFGAGKTTLLNALSLYVPSRVQLAVVETFEELKIAHPHPLRVVVGEDQPDFPTMDTVLNLIITRMRPDLLIIGEIVREEAARFLDAISLGKRAWATIHGNDALGALRRLETKALATGLPLQAIREQVAAGVDLVVHLRQDAGTGRRYVAQVVRVRGLDEHGRYQLETIYDTGYGATSLLDQLCREVGG